MIRNFFKTNRPGMIRDALFVTAIALLCIFWYVPVNYFMGN